MIEHLFIGVDPGLHVGLAVLDGDRFTAVELSRTAAEDKLHALLWGQRRKTVIAVERFSMSGRKTHQPDALEVIGVARFLARRGHAAAFLLQGSAEATRTGSAEVLRALGWWQRGAADHVHRACSQVALALALTCPEDFARRLGPGMMS